MPEKKETIVVSACLLGEKCRYDGQLINNKQVDEIAKEYAIIPVCPEVLGGLPTPRAAAEIDSGDGNCVLDSNARVLTDNGEDVTDKFLNGAHETLRIAKRCGASKAIMKSKSPSCGVYGIIRNGRLCDGIGVTAALLKRHGFSLEEID